jgi:hypothetical protein
MKPENIINEITQVRSRNNFLWMSLLTLAMKAKPKEAKKILQAINENDKEISGWLEKLQH